MAPCIKFSTGPFTILFEQTLQTSVWLSTTLWIYFYGHSNIYYLLTSYSVDTLPILVVFNSPPFLDIFEINPGDLLCISIFISFSFAKPLFNSE